MTVHMVNCTSMTIENAPHDDDGLSDNDGTESNESNDSIESYFAQY